VIEGGRRGLLYEWYYLGPISTVLPLLLLLVPPELLLLLLLPLLVPVSPPFYCYVAVSMIAPLFAVNPCYHAIIVLITLF